MPGATFCAYQRFASALAGTFLVSASLARGQTECWGRLTDDDLDVINGRQDQLEGKIQERYGLAKDQAKKDVDAWFRSLP
jgi:uncharacterized protein YjbJ (UPF0337 family)